MVTFWLSFVAGGLVAQAAVRVGVEQHVGRVADRRAEVRVPVGRVVVEAQPDRVVVAATRSRGTWCRSGWCRCAVEIRSATASVDSTLTGENGSQCTTTAFAFALFLVRLVTQRVRPVATGTPFLMSSTRTSNCVPWSSLFLSPTHRCTSLNAVIVCSPVPWNVLVKVQVTLAPAARVMVATRVLVSPLPPVLQSRPVRAQLATRSLRSRCTGPGRRPVNVVVFVRAGSASSSRENGASPVPVVVKPKSTGLSGDASLLMVIEPSLVFVKVQVTSAPATRLMVATRVPVSPVPPVRAVEAGELPVRDESFGHAVGAGEQAGEGGGVGQCRVGVVIERERRETGARRGEGEVDAGLSGMASLLMVIEPELRCW